MIQINEKNCTPYIGDAKLKKIVQGSSQIIWEETVVTYKPVYYGFMNERVFMNSGLTPTVVKERLSSGSTELDVFKTDFIIPKATYPDYITTENEFNEWLDNLDSDEYEEWQMSNNNVCVVMYPLGDEYHPFDINNRDVFLNYTPPFADGDDVFIDSITYKVKYKQKTIDTGEYISYFKATKDGTYDTMRRV